MKAYHSLRAIKRPPSRSVVAVGVFDGIHIGHQSLIKALVKRAKTLKAQSLVLTFYPHPSLVLHPKRPTPLLISLEHRLRLLEEMGIDIAVIVRFTRAFSEIKPQRFLRDILIKRLGMVEMLVGDNFIFGKGGGGNIRFLKRLSGVYGFKLRKRSLLRVNERTISSTFIRSLIIKGRLKEASGLLGRPVSILGTVKRGTERGRILGFPTANIDPHHEAIPPSGVYAVYVILGKKRYNGILNIGFRPTFHSKRYTQYAIRNTPEPTIEVHIFDFNRDIYSRGLEIIFKKRIRPERRFKAKECLIKRIILDIKAAKKVLNR